MFLLCSSNFIILFHGEHSDYSVTAPHCWSFKVADDGRKKSDQDLEINTNAHFPVKHTFVLAVFSVDVKIRCGALWSNKGSVLSDIETAQDPHRSNIACQIKAMCRWPLPPFIAAHEEHLLSKLPLICSSSLFRLRRTCDKRWNPPGVVVTW